MENESKRYQIWKAISKANFVKCPLVSQSSCLKIFYYALVRRHFESRERLMPKTVETEAETVHEEHEVIFLFLSYISLSNLRFLFVFKLDSRTLFFRLLELQDHQKKSRLSPWKKSLRLTPWQLWAWVALWTAVIQRKRRKRNENKPKLNFIQNLSLTFIKLQCMDNCKYSNFLILGKVWTTSKRLFTV